MPPRRENQELTSPWYVPEVPIVWRQTDETISHSGRSNYIPWLFPARARQSRSMPFVPTVIGAAAATLAAIRGKTRTSRTTPIVTGLYHFVHTLE